MGHDFSRQWVKFVDQQWGEGARRGAAGRGGPPPWMAGLFGLNQVDQQRPPRARRGDVRAAILDVLRYEPFNGYQIIGQISERSEGAWKPSPGSVYPTLQQLEDEGLVEADAERGRRAFRLTEAGAIYVGDNAAEIAAVWLPFQTSSTGTARVSRPDPVSDSDSDSADAGSAGAGSAGAGDFATLKPEIGQVMSAVWQIISTGTEAQRRDAIAVLIETRRKLYGILAEGDDAP